MTNTNQPATLNLIEFTPEEFDEAAPHPGVWCEANLTHEPKSCIVGGEDEDYEEQWGSRFVWRGAHHLTNRTGQQFWLCPDCADAIDQHREALGEPDPTLTEVVFFLYEDAQPLCDVGHSPSHGGQYAVDYGHHSPRPRMVCGDCLGTIIDDLRVMGWAASIEEKI